MFVLWEEGLEEEATLRKHMADCAKPLEQRQALLENKG